MFKSGTVFLLEWLIILLDTRGLVQKEKTRSFKLSWGGGSEGAGVLR